MLGGQTPAFVALTMKVLFGQKAGPSGVLTEHARVNVANQTVRPSLFAVITVRIIPRGTLRLHRFTGM
jgi:hypothetical protein